MIVGVQPLGLSRRYQSQVLQGLMFQVSGVGPMMGQVMLRRKRLIAARGDSGGSGGTGGGGSSCETVATSPGTWDITLEYAGGDPASVTELDIVQTSCTVTMSASDPSIGSISITGPLSDTVGNR